MSDPYDDFINGLDLDDDEQSQATVEWQDEGGEWRDLGELTTWELSAPKYWDLPAFYYDADFETMHIEPQAIELEIRIDHVDYELLGKLFETPKKPARPWAWLVAIAAVVAGVLMRRGARK